LDLEFPGGTVKEYVDQLREARPDGAANVLVMPDARDLKVPPVTLLAVTVEAAVQALEGTYTLPDGRRADIDVSSYTIGDSPDLVMKIQADYEIREAESSVWSVDEALMHGQTAEELLGAIEAVLSVFPDKAKVSYHPPTRLLIARGPGEQLDLVREAIEALTDGAERRRNRMESLKDDIDFLNEQVQELTGAIKVGEQELALARSRHTRMLDLRERDSVRPDEVAEAEIEVTKAETELENHKVRYGRLRDKLDSLKAALKDLQKSRE
jgi:hypothetical protein